MNAETAIVAQEAVDDDIIEKLIIGGDLSRLTPQQKVTYYNKVCESMGLNPLTRPFEYTKLSGKETLYPGKNCADQLRKINGINLEVVSQTVREGLLTVHVRARDKAGRIDEDFGVVSIAGLRGDAASNAFMKAITKAKRRATLSIVGLGWSDDSEIDSIPGAVRQPFPHLEKPSPAEGKSTEPSPAADELAPDPGIEPYELEYTTNSEEEWKRWGNDLFAYIKAAKTFQRIDEWIVANSEGFEALKHYDAGKFNRLRHMIQAVQDAKAKAAPDDTK